MTLTELAQRYGCDKLAAHSYIDSGFYEELFRGRTVKRLLDIGIGYENLMAPFVPFYVHGSSLYMWRDFFQKAEIFGCDIREDTLFQDERIHTMVCDQSNRESLIHMIYEFTDKLTKGFDVVVDDGSHQAKDQILTAVYVLPHMNEGSCYIVEDCQEPEKVVSALGCGEIHRFNKRPDDVLVIIKK